MRTMKEWVFLQTLHPGRGRHHARGTYSRRRTKTQGTPRAGRVRHHARGSPTRFSRLAFKRIRFAAFQRIEESILRKQYERNVKLNRIQLLWGPRPLYTCRLHPILPHFGPTLDSNGSNRVLDQPNSTLSNDSIQ
ncbi:hypothetical protein JCGZ_07928 [Jatropha curcas]|uniref:Uncharacterized protein n=1 Tax=Jatropha curcas TaxID=180498 RepID=A0A067KN56_JATCU|nr:hypothetical protein JCGZ_07928 [Jatropha curcas]